MTGRNMTAPFSPRIALCTLRYSELYQRHSYLDQQLINERLREDALTHDLGYLESRLAGLTTNEDTESRKDLRNQIRSLKFRLRRCSAVMETLHVGLTELSNQMQTLEQQQWNNALDPYAEHSMPSHTDLTAVSSSGSTIRATPTQAGSTGPIPNQWDRPPMQVADEVIRNEITSKTARQLGPDDTAWVIHSDRLALLADNSDSQSACDGSVSDLELAISPGPNYQTEPLQDTTNIMLSSAHSGTRSRG